MGSGIFRKNKVPAQGTPAKSRPGSDDDLTEGSLLPKLIRFCIPLMLTGMLQLLYNASDMVVVGQFDSPDAVGAVGSSGSLINLMVNLFIGLSVGVSVNVAQYIGARRPRDVDDVVHTSVAMAIILGVLVAIPGYLFAEDALRMMNASENLLAKAAPYVRAYMVGVPALTMYNYCAAVLRAKGDTVRPLIFLGVSGLVNVVLNVIMVAGFHLGALGVGVATTVSQYVSAVMILIYMTFRLEDPYRIHWGRLRINRDKLWKIIRVGLPAGLQSTLFSISNVLIQSAVNTFPDAVVNGNAAAANLDGFIYNAQNSVYHASITFVGQHVGARKYKRLNRVLFSCLGLVTVIGIAIGTVEILFAHPLLGIYVPGDEGAIAWGTQRLLMMGLTYFLCGWMEVCCGALRGMGKTITPMLVSLAGACLLRIVWIYTIFRWEPTMMCLYISYPVSWLVTAGVEFALYFIFKGRIERADSAPDVTEEQPVQVSQEL